MSHNHYLSIKWPLVLLIGAHAACFCRAEESARTSGPAKVEVRQMDGRWQLLVNHQPFFIKGAGFEMGDQEKLAAAGGNSFRTWRPSNGRESGKELLDHALKK